VITKQATKKAATRDEPKKPAFSCLHWGLAGWASSATGANMAISKVIIKCRFVLSWGQRAQLNVPRHFLKGLSADLCHHWVAAVRHSR
jgi:hypothetical protein